MRQRILKGNEEQEQEALFEWAMYHKKSYPDLELMFHVPNGGKRDKATAVCLRRQGVKAGVPDIMLPAPRGKYAGLFIELKVGSNKPTPKQKHFLTNLMDNGYCCIVSYGAEEARTAIELYLNEDNNRLQMYEDFTMDVLARVKDPEGPVL